MRAADGALRFMRTAGKVAPKRKQEEEDMAAASFAFHRLDWIDGFKGFVLFGIFNVIYMTLTTLRTDWMFSFSTREHYERARTNIGAMAFDQRTTIGQQVDFLNQDFDMLTTNLASVCVDCRVALTDANKDLKDMDLTEFVCTDFDSTEGSDSYPDRDCTAVDADYAAAPASTKAPCCMNQALVQASMAIMTWNRFAPEFLERDFLTPGVISIADLTEIDYKFTKGPPNFGSDSLAQWKRDVFNRIAPKIPSHSTRAGSYLYVTNSVLEGFIAQVIVSRSQHMIGIECKAQWLNYVNSPGIVVPTQTFWSFNFNVPPAIILLNAFMYIFWFLTIAHEMLQFYEACDTWKEVRTMACTPYYVFYVATTALPVLSELLKSQTTVSTWTLWISMNQILMSVRSFDEGKVLRPFELVVKTIKAAFISLSYVMLVVVVTSIVIMLIYGQLFGVFDSRLNAGTWGLARIFKMLTTPPPLESSHVTQSVTGALVLYYWTTFLIRLTFGSFVIAVIVGSFNTTRAKIEKEISDYNMLPDGWVRPTSKDDVPELSISETAWYLLTWRLYGKFMPQLYRDLRRLKKEAQVVGDMERGDHDHLWPISILKSKFGEDTGKALIENFAVIRATELAKQEANQVLTPADIAERKRLQRQMDDEEERLIARLEVLRQERLKRAAVRAATSEMVDAVTSATKVLQRAIVMEASAATTGKESPVSDLDEENGNRVTSTTVAAF